MLITTPICTEPGYSKHKCQINSALNDDITMFFQLLYPKFKAKCSSSPQMIILNSKWPGLAFRFLGLVLFPFGHHCTGLPHNLSLSSSLLSHLNIKNNLLHNLTMIQFLLPLLVAGIANAAIYCKLKVDILNTFTCWW